MGFGSLLGGGLGQGQLDPYLELMRQQMLHRPEHPQANVTPKDEDTILLLLTEEE